MFSILEKVQLLRLIAMLSEPIIMENFTSPSKSIGQDFNEGNESAIKRFF